MDDYVAARAETKHWQAVARELQAERDAVAADASLGLRAQNGRFASGLWDREKLGEVWRREGEFVWVRVEGREWMREAREGFGRCGRRVVGGVEGKGDGEEGEGVWAWEEGFAWCFGERGEVVEWSCGW